MKILELSTKKMTHINVIVPFDESHKLLDWFYQRGGHSLRSGPKPIGDAAVDKSKYQLVGWIDGSWLQVEIEGQLRAL